jgi:hypothetical protein
MKKEKKEKKKKEKEEKEEEKEEKEKMKKGEDEKTNGMNRNDTTLYTHRQFVEKIKDNQKRLEEELIPHLIKALGFFPSSSSSSSSYSHPLSSCVKLVSPYAYPSWSSFLLSLQYTGGIVEVVPHPSSIIGHPVVEIVVEPSGNVYVVFVGERLFSSEFVSVGTLVPQRCVPTIALHDASVVIGKSCFEKKMMGVPFLLL